MRYEGARCSALAASNSSANSKNCVLLSDTCMSYVISHTSPRDACRASLVSRSVKCFANSDSVWERFLPSDYEEVISRSVTPVIYSSKKELYLRLCDSSILLDDGSLYFKPGCDAQFQYDEHGCCNECSCETWMMDSVVRFLAYRVLESVLTN